jgi:predicted transcriptional regulator
LKGHGFSRAVKTSEVRALASAGWFLKAESEFLRTEMIRVRSLRRGWRIDQSSPMKKLTFSADDDIVRKARLIARARHTTLNSAFRVWLTQFATSDESTMSFDCLMEKLRYVNAGQHFTRDELNRR